MLEGQLPASRATRLATHLGLPTHQGLRRGVPGNQDFSPVSLQAERRIVSVALSLTRYYYNVERPLAVNAPSLVARTFLT